nr:hypothetical protein [Tanacetum cinerariifolium]
MRMRESANRDLDTSTWDVRRGGVEVFWCESMAEEQDEQQQQNMLDVELVPINKIALEKTQPYVIYKVCLEILKQYSFYNALIATIDAPEIYMQQFWHIVSYDLTAKAHLFMIDNQVFEVNAYLLRNALRITPKDPNHPFALPAPEKEINSYINQLRCSKTTRTISAFKFNDMYNIIDHDYQVEQVGLAGDLGSINDVLILLVRPWTVDYFNFQQDLDETLYQAWEQFKELLLRCHQHYLTDMQEAADVRKSIQEMVDYFLKWHNKTSTRCRSIETSNGLGAIQAQLNNLGREIKKVNEKVYAAQVGCELCKESHYTKDCPLKEERKTLEESYYSQFGVPFPQGGQYRAAPPEFYLRNNGNPSYQERRQRMEESLSKNQGASIKALEIQIGQMSKVLQQRGSRSLPSSTKTNPRDHVKSISTTVETDTFLIRRIRPIRYAVSSLQNIDFIVLDMPEDIKTPLILGRPFLSTAHAKTDVFKRKITLRIRNEKVVFKSDKPTSSIIKRVYALSLIERLELDLEARLMGKALILNRSLDPLYGDYIELNEPLELRRNRVDNLEPTIKEGYEHVNANFFHLLSINVMSKSFYNSIIKDKVEFKGKNVVRAFMNVPIFVGKFSAITNFIVVENMDSYRDERMGDILVGRPFCKEACIKSRQFDGIITIYKGNDSVTYQMARSHLRFKHLTNA